MRIGEGPEILIGIDEAGRGPLIGDMVVAGVMGTREQFEKLANIGIRDSKSLSPDQRYSLYWVITETGLHVFISYISPCRIDSENLNRLTINSMKRILSYFAKIAQDVDQSIGVFIDDVKGAKTLIETYTRSLFKRLTVFVMEPRADSKHIPVATASIVAKVNRDRNIEIARKLLGDFGSGYPSDPLARKWLIEKQHELLQPPLLLRRSWSVVRDLAPLWYREKKKPGKSLLDFVEKK